MKCFDHPEKDAVGSCKSCGKGVCSECAVDLTKGLACRGRCEQDTRALITLIDQNIKLSARAVRIMDEGKRTRRGTQTFNIVTGAIFVLWGLSDPERFTFLIILGVCFLVWGLYSFVATRRLGPQAPGSKTSDA